MKRWLIAVVVLLVLAGVAATAVVLGFDPNSQKPRIIAAAYRATGRQLTLAGPLHVAWSLSPALAATDVSLANMPGGSHPDMVRVARVTARLSLLPLLSGRVEIGEITLDHPDILLETDAAGRANWQFSRPVSPPGAPAGPSHAQTPTVLDRLVAQQGSVTWRDGATGVTRTASLPSAVLDLGQGRAHLVASAQTSGTGVTLDATLGTWAQVTAPAGAWPVQAAATAGVATATVNGVADPALHSFTGQVHADIPDLAQLGSLVQRPDLLPLQGIHLTATIPGANAMPQDVSLTIGASDLAPIMPGATLAALRFDWPAGQPARLTASGSMPGGPWTVATGIVRVAAGAALRGLLLSTPAGDLAGDLALTLGGVPAMRGTVVAERVDVDALRALPLGSPVANPVATAATPVPSAAPGTPLGRELPWAQLRRANADLQLAIGTLHVRGADYHNASGHVVLQDGALTIDPAAVQTPEGAVDFSASVDARQPSPPVTVNMRSAAMALNPLLLAAGLPGGSGGTAGVDVALHAAGNTVAALAATLVGHAGVAVVDADISNAVLMAGLGGVLPSTGLKIDPSGVSHVRCLAVAATAAAGQVTLSTLALDSSRLALSGTGTIDLVHDMLALHLRPVIRLGGAGVAAPVRVSGPLAKPLVAFDPVGADGRVGVTFGAGVSAPDTCAADLAAARFGLPGPLPAEAPKTTKPADLLRSFLK